MNRFMRFPGGKTKVVTLSYDDCMEEDQKLIDLMEKYKMKCTFNLIPGWFAEEGKQYPADETYRLTSASLAKKMYHHPLVEVANHGFQHQYMSALTQAEMADDMLTCRKALEKMFKRNVRGMAYPYGWYSEELMQVLAMCGIQYSRTVNSTNDFSIPENWLEWHPTCHHDDERLMELTEQFVQKNVKENPLLFYVWGHTFEFERNNNWNRIEEFMQAVSGREDTWYATNGEIYEYIKAYENLDISVDGKRIINHGRMPVWVAIKGTCYQVDDELIVE